MPNLDARLQRLEAEQRAAWFARTAALFTERTGHLTTTADVEQLLADVETEVAPYLAAGLEPLAAYARVAEVDEATLLAEAEWWAEAVPA